MSRFSRLFEQFRTAARPEEPEKAERSEIGWIVMGLGNPGEQYRRSRHNLGFMTVQRFAARFNSELNRRKFNGIYAQILTDAGSIILVMPHTFYNRSGDCASGILGYYKVPPARLIVIHDEMDLPEGQLRLKIGGGDAGNRGVRSIAEALGTPDFIRLRIGIAHPEESHGNIDYLLRPLTDEELHMMGAVTERAVDAALAIISDGLDRARSTYNQRV